ncbi:MAG TPA: PH domain-containing protein [Xanthobacteraceae bacterium]|nr:PH domain-containing protein [Xanthobacteraceae bacterium]
MSYVKHVIQPGEEILVDGRLSWVLYLPAILYLIAGLVLIAVENAFWSWSQPLITFGTIVVFGILTLVSLANAWFRWWTTEIAVTNKRIIYKTGFINRHTEEMNMDKVSSVDVDQSIWGRIFDFGTIRILGAGGAGRSKNEPGIERLDMVGSPIKLRNAIDVR